MMMFLSFLACCLLLPSLFSRILEEGADWMKAHIDEQRVVYVHCKSGIGRSASVVAAYFMKHRHMGAQDAVAFIRRQRPEIFRPSSAQMRSLLDYETTIRTEQKFSVQP
jgi:protein-tyrosine phosphatase